MSPKLKNQDIRSRMDYADDTLEAERFADMFAENVISLDEVRDDLHIGEMDTEGRDADEEFYGEA